MKSKTNTSLLFDTVGYKMGILPGFKKSRSARYISSHNTTGKPATFFRPAAKALILFTCNCKKVYAYEELTSSEIYSSDEGIGGAVGIIPSSNGDIYIAEYRQSNTVTHFAAFDTEKKEFIFAGISHDNGTSYEEYRLDFSDGRNGTVLWLCLMPYLASKSNEINDIVSDVKIFQEEYRLVVNGKESELHEAQNKTLLFCDSIYYTVDCKNSSLEIPVTIPSKGYFPVVPDVVKSGAYKPQTVITGVFRLKGLGNETKAELSKEITSAELKGLYALNPNMTDEEKANVQEMSSYFIPPRLVLKAAQRIKSAYDNPCIPSECKPMNVLFFGPPGGGKTEDGKALASALGLPCVHESLSAHSDESFATGKIFPKVMKDKEAGADISKESVVEGYDSLKDLIECAEMAPESVYEEITGKENPSATLADVIAAYTEKCEKRAVKKARAKMSNSNNGIEYEFVPSRFLKAIQNGWLVILEEPTNVRDSAVLTLINQLMDGYQMITLPTGEIIKRHPRTVIVFACNVDEQQTGELQTSTLSRLPFKYYVDFPSQSEMINRIKRMTGFSNDKELEKMARVVSELRKYVDNHGLVGVCGVREFAAWAIAREADLAFNSSATLRDSAMDTIVPSASPHREDREEIIRDIIEPLLNEH